MEPLFQAVTDRLQMSDDGRGAFQRMRDRPTDDEAKDAAIRALQFELDRDRIFAARIQVLLQGEDIQPAQPPRNRLRNRLPVGVAAVLLVAGLAVGAALVVPRVIDSTPTVQASPSPSPFGPNWAVQTDLNVAANDIEFDKRYGDLLATADVSGSVSLYKVSSRTRLARFDSSDGTTTGNREMKRIEFSSDGSRLVAGGMRGQIEIWNLDTGQLVTKPFGIGKMGAIYGVSFAPNQQTVASASADGTVRVWNATNGEQIGDPIRISDPDVPFQVAVNAVEFSPNGQILAALGDDGLITFWDVETHEKIRSTDSPSTTVGTDGDDLAYRPDGRAIATVSASGLHMWDSRTGRTIPVPKTDAIGGFAFRADGAMFASGSLAGPVRLFKPDTLAAAGNPPPGEFRFVDAVAFSATGRFLAAAESDGQVRVWTTR